MSTPVSDTTNRSAKTEAVSTNSHTLFALALALFFAGRCGTAPASGATAPAAVKGLAAWYDAADTATMSTAEGVAQWNDKSGLGNNVVPLAAANFPTLQSSTLNGLPTIRISNATTSGTQALVDTAFTPTTMTATTIFIVHAVHSMPANYGRTLGFWNGSNDYVNGIDIGSPASAQSSFDARWIEGAYPVGGSNANNLLTGSTPFGTYVLERDHASSTQVDVTLNGTAQASQTSTTSGPIESNDFGIGTSRSSSYLSSDESIAEIAIYNVTLSTANMQLIEGYLACKWGLQGSLPAGHPYKSTCPSASTKPTSVSGLIGWYDASDTSTITPATLVTQWGDKSGNGNTLTQSSSSAQPYVTTTNSQQALMFSGTQQLLSSTTNTLATGSNPSTLFAVAAFTGSLTGGYGFLFTYGASANNEERGLTKKNSSADVNCQEYSADITLGTGWSTAASIAYANFGNSTEACAQNGAAATTASYTPQTPASTALYLGSRLSSNYWIGPLYEVLVYNSALSTTERQFVEGYLACKWGLQSSLPTTHPYYSACPSTATANLSLALSESPTGGAIPGTIVTYTTTLTNASGTLVYSPVITTPVPGNTWFEVGSAAESLGNTGLTAAVTYSSNSGSTYTYTPVSGGGGAASGYDANVTNVRFSLSGSVGPAPSVNSGAVSFGVRVI